MSDFSQLTTLRNDLAKAGDRADKDAQGLAKRSALEIKKKMKVLFEGNGHAPRVPYSIDFEAESADGLSYRIGELYDRKGTQWGIAAILVYGTSNNGPSVDDTAALAAELPTVEHWLGENGEADVLGPK